MASTLPACSAVWHDLFTNAVRAAMDFYARLLGWTYEIEHASNFVWTGSRADYPLIIHDETAHGGFVPVNDQSQRRWLPYFLVDSVAEQVALLAELGATIERTPFDIPGVGRSAVSRDPQGAVFCLYACEQQTHRPQGTFVAEELITRDSAAASLFYEKSLAVSLRPCSVRDARAPELLDIIRDVSGPNTAAAWVPYLSTDDVRAAVDRATQLGATCRFVGVAATDGHDIALLEDPTRAIFGITGE